jgi:transcriptional regulator with GAF, ATPase, and Fis domain
MREKRTFSEQVREYETRLICEALAHTQGHQAKAARVLGLPPTTLASQLKRLGIDPGRFRKPLDLVSLPPLDNAENHVQ